ncbi:MAG: DUF6516 family protein [Deltaproteobacteria bacterium]
MNERIRSHFDEIEARLIECPVIRAYEITRKDISLDDGKLRIKSALTGGGVFECFLYLKDTGHSIYPLKFSFHWQDKEGKTIRRLDNAPHHTDLPYAPNHLHMGGDHIEGFAGSPDIFAFIDNMEITILGTTPL